MASREALAMKISSSNEASRARSGSSYSIDNHPPSPMHSNEHASKAVLRSIVHEASNEAGDFQSKPAPMKIKLTISSCCCLSEYSGAQEVSKI